MPGPGVIQMAHGEPGLLDPAGGFWGVNAFPIHTRASGGAGISILMIFRKYQMEVGIQQQENLQSKLLRLIHFDLLFQIRN